MKFCSSTDTTNTTAAENEKHSNIKRRIKQYRDELKKTEAALWQPDCEHELLEKYQNASREMEAEYSRLEEDKRHHFYITIPVADRPVHLETCLNSILHLCKTFHYGGISKQENHAYSYKKIHVIIADDSASKENIARHKKLVSHFQGKGLDTEYFGLKQQIDTIKNLIADKNLKNTDSLQRIIGDINNALTHEKFSHKGASITRNISYLRLNEIHLSLPEQNKLFYFIDSDQEFCVKHQNNEKYYAISYFHHLDEIFTHQDVGILTGKVVGDPPVSPAVMAAKFQDDVLLFLETVFSFPPGSPCPFHANKPVNCNDASYHDMAKLFGFEDNSKAHSYQCQRTDQHTNADCFHDFSMRLKHFFHGEHATRETVFQYNGDFTRTQPARTVYTGNYIFKPDRLKHFITFATLKLRMAGPTLGRLLQFELGEEFVSANLPMLHNRTVSNLGKSEYRAGVEHYDNTVDLAGEFEKQYYGDVLLFSIIKLTEEKSFAKEEEHIYSVLQATEKNIQQLYQDKHRQIIQKAMQLKHQLNSGHIWYQDKAPDKNPLPSNLIEAVNNFEKFIDNILYNFGSNSSAYQLIHSTEHIKTRLQQLTQAIIFLDKDKQLWDSLISHRTSVKYSSD